MIKKRITLSDWTYIGKYNVCYDWARGLCDYYLLLDKDKAMYRKQDIKTWFYVLTFVPICLVNIVLCIIDGGLVEFEIPYKTLDKSNFLWYNIGVRWWILWKSIKQWSQEKFFVMKLLPMRLENLL